MNDGFLRSLSVIAAVVIVVGGAYLILQKAGSIVELGPSVSVQPRSQEPTKKSRPAPAGQRTDSGIYRCSNGGSVIYSDSPCPGGRVVDVQVTHGFEPQRVPHSSPRGQAADPAPSAPRTPAIAQSNGSPSEALCAQISRDIESIDSAARAGGSITHMEALKERRRKLVENRQELRC